MKVLIVDDSIIAFANIATMVKQLGLEVIGHVTTEHEIEKTLRNHKPELILIDTRGSYLQGDNTIRKIKALSPETRVIAISVFDTPQSVKKIYASGIYDIISKPVESERFLLSLRQLVPDGTHRGM